MKIKPFFQVLSTIFALLITMAGCFTAAFFLTSAVFRFFRHSPPVLLVQMINSFLGLFMSILIFIFINAKIIRPGQGGVFESIIHAQKKMAGGDFNVRVEDENEGKGAFGVLVESVNNMAVGLGRLETMRQEFIANVSHEIQSPLTSIRGFARALRNEKLKHEKRLYYLDIIEAESMRLSRLSDNLLKLASLDAEAESFQRKSYRLDKQIKNTILACEAEWLNKKINMEVSLDEVVIQADEDMLSQVWINLIHNSIKFTPQEGNIRIDLHRQDDRIEFMISDTGAGITEEDQVHIFERFYKADKLREYSRKGNGLGLAIAKKIVDKHHGTISVQSKPGEGARFTVSLPEISSPLA